VILVTPRDSQIETKLNRDHLKIFETFSLKMNRQALDHRDILLVFNHLVPKYNLTVHREHLRDSKKENYLEIPK